METMKLEITVIAEPFSINKAYYLKSYGNKAATKVRTAACREWGDRVLFQLQQYVSEMKQCHDFFDQNAHALRIDLIHYIPEEKFYTKAGHISIASSDITNIEKLFVDLVFDERFSGRSLDTVTVQNLNINDKFIVDMRSRKLPSYSGYKIKIIVEIINKPETTDEENS